MMMTRLAELTESDAQEIRDWRNRDLSGLRTPYLLTPEMQAGWYENVVCARDSPHRYWAVRSQSEVLPVMGKRGYLGRTEIMTQENRTVGMVGLTYISWENGLAEIALVTDPDRRRQGIGREAVRLVLREAFGNLGLHQVFGECYHCNPALGFWERLIAENGWHATRLPDRKRWAGRWHYSTYFAIMAPMQERRQRIDPDQPGSAAELDRQVRDLIADRGLARYVGEQYGVMLG